jgi:hypothetical protein
VNYHRCDSEYEHNIHKYHTQWKQTVHNECILIGHDDIGAHGRGHSEQNSSFLFALLLKGLCLVKKAIFREQANTSVK